jgi:hypothetical protein
MVKNSIQLAASHINGDVATLLQAIKDLIQEFHIYTPAGLGRLHKGCNFN